MGQSGATDFEQHVARVMRNKLQIAPETSRWERFVERKGWD